MGCGASKKNSNMVQEPAPNSPSIKEIQPSNQPTPQSPPLLAVSPQQASVRGRSPSLNSQVSAKKNLSNSIGRRTPFRKLDNNTPRENDNILLSSNEKPTNKSSSRSSRRASSLVPKSPINRSRIDSNSSSESLKHLHRKSSATSHKEFGRCSHCPHCQRVNNQSKSSIPSIPQPKWLTENPGPDQVAINMDDYDVEAVKKKIISENGHLPGSYDYRPHLTIEQLPDYNQIKENYYTQPLVANTQPRISPTRTPFPEYDLLQRLEHRLNKPNTLTLFD